MVMETVFTGRDGRVRLTDALALAPGARGHEVGMESPHTLVRIVEAIEGRLELRMELVPRLEYGLVVPEFAEDDGLVRTEGGADRLLLRTDAPVVVRDDRVVARMTLQKGDAVQFALLHERRPARRGEPLAPRRAMDETIAGWRSWSEAHRRYSGPWRREVERSALVLQALTHQPSGAIVGAPTTSLPEAMGGEDNWDYRYAWLRDASMTIQALSIAACDDEVARNFDWMARVAVGAEREGALQIVFGVEGERELTEHTLPHLRGHGGSAPVRVGNAAWRQTQLDVFGEVLASAHLLLDRLGDLDPGTAVFLSGLANLAADRWREPDSGIWEGREGERDYLTSKVMCWVALDRALDMADVLGARRASGSGGARSATRCAARSSRGDGARNATRSRGPSTPTAWTRAS